MEPVNSGSYVLNLGCYCIKRTGRVFFLYWYGEAGKYNIMVREDIRIVMLAHNLGDSFINIVITCMQENIYVTIVHAIANKVVVGIVTCDGLYQIVVTYQLLEERDSHGIIGVNIPISSDIQDQVSVACNQLIQAVPQLCQIRHKLAVFTLCGHIQGYMNRGLEAWLLEDDGKEGGGVGGYHLDEGVQFPEPHDEGSSNGSASDHGEFWVQRVVRV